MTLDGQGRDYETLPADASGSPAFAVLIDPDHPGFPHPAINN
jgi:hypothetical protein